MPICIECRYPVPQLYHVLHSTSKPPVTPAPTPSSTSHQKSTSNGSQILAAATASIANANSGTKGGGEASKKSSSSSDVRLTQCPRCKRFADKYVEHDFVVLFIDLVLVKPQVYRHLLFNRLGRDDNAFDPSITRLGTLLLLFDVYLTWSSIEALPANETASSSIPHLPIIIQYLFFLLLCLSTTAAQHLTIRALARLPVFRTSPPANPPSTFNTNGAQTPATAPVGGGAGHNPYFTPPPSATTSSTNLLTTLTPSTPTLSQPGYQNPTSPNMPPPQTPYHPYPSHPPPSSSSLPLNTNASTTLSLPSSTLSTPPKPAAISTALFVSSCMKLFPILMVVWRFEDKGAKVARGVGWAVAVQNVEALRILLGVGYVKAAVLVAAGKMVGEGVGWGVLGGFGLG
ncbi:sterol homeostasis protein [Thelotrema lepadinum]|nr:sterol homeostasis protein [Thelotrema lepadinum]